MAKGQTQYGLVVTVLRPSEQQDVRLGAVDGVVDPATALLNTNGAPLLLAEQTVLRNVFGDVLRQDYVTVQFCEGKGGG